MTTYIIKRTFEAILVILFISSVSFFMLFLVNDPALVLLPPETTVEDIEFFKKQAGLDQPLIFIYYDYIKNVITDFNFGISFTNQAPVLEVIAEAVPVTLKLALTSLLIVNIVGITVGTIAAVKRYSLWDNVTSFLVMLGQATPLYWLGIVLMIIFGLKLGWTPISGIGGWEYYILPTITLSSWIIPINMRLIRSGMLEVLLQDYIRTARAKGLSEKIVYFKHAFKNACIPLITIVALQFAELLSGAVVTETVFALPGMGRLTIDAIFEADFPLIQAIVILFGAAVVFGNLLADILAAYIDPRIRLS